MGFPRMRHDRVAKSVVCIRSILLRPLTAPQAAGCLGVGGQRRDRARNGSHTVGDIVLFTGYSQLTPALSPPASPTWNWSSPATTAPAPCGRTNTVPILNRI
jgi:hypothetical protein